VCGSNGHLYPPMIHYAAQPTVPNIIPQIALPIIEAVRKLKSVGTGIVGDRGGSFTRSSREHIIKIVLFRSERRIRGRLGRQL
jgi:hypothetical protein